MLSLAAVVLFPNLPTGDLAMPMLATAVLPATLGAILLAAITAAMMSTVDSLLLVAGSALSVDIYQLFRPDAPPGRRLWMDRAGILVVGTIPVILLLSGVGEGELVQFIVLLFTALMASSFFIPVVVGVYWRRATREGAAAAMVGGVDHGARLGGVGPADAIDPVLPGFLVSAFLMVTVSLLTPPPPASATEPYMPAPREP